MLSFPSASFRLGGAVLDLASCEVSYKVYVNGVICSGLRGRAAQEGATGSTELTIVEEFTHADGKQPPPHF